MRTLGSSAGVIILSILASVVIARALGPAGKGTYVVAVQAVSILIALGQFGLPEVMLYQMRKEHRQTEALAGNNLVILLASSVLIAVIILVGYPLLANSVFKGVSSGLLWLAFWMVPFNLGFLFYSRLVQLDGRVGLYNILCLIRAGVWLSVLLLWIWIWPGNVKVAVLALVTSHAVVALLSFYIVWRKVTARHLCVNFRLIKESLLGGIKVQGGMVAVLLGNQLGIFILNIYSDQKAVGWFSTALGVANFLLLFSTSIRTVLQSWMPGNSQTKSEVLSKTINLTRHTLLVLVAGTIALVVVGMPLIRFLYGAAFVPAYTPMLFLLVGIVARGVGQIFTSYLAFENCLGLNSIAAILAVCVNAGLACWLVPEFGIIGASVATSVGQFVSMVFLLICFIHLTGRHLQEFLPGFTELRFYIALLQRQRESLRFFQ